MRRAPRWPPPRAGVALTAADDFGPGGGATIAGSSSPWAESGASRGLPRSPRLTRFLRVSTHVTPARIGAAHEKSGVSTSRKKIHERIAAESAAYWSRRRHLRSLETPERVHPQRIGYHRRSDRGGGSRPTRPGRSSGAGGSAPGMRNAGRQNAVPETIAQSGHRHRVSTAPEAASEARYRGTSRRPRRE